MTKITKKKENEVQKKEQKQNQTQVIANLTETLKRLQAEFENYKKRTDSEKTEYKKYAEEQLIKDLLPLLDNFELALKNKDNKEEFTKGVELIYSQLFQMMEDRGLKPIKAEGEKFDPYEHEALLVAESDQNDIILQELQKGYVLHDKVIRHTKVKVGKQR